MAWVILLASAVLEAVWASALGASAGLTRPLPTAVFLVGLTLSMAGLARATRQIPIGTAYPVWVGVGAVLTVAWGVLSGTESLSAPRALFLGGIIAAVVGLKLLDGRRADVTV